MDHSLGMRRNSLGFLLSLQYSLTRLENNLRVASRDGYIELLLQELQIVLLFIMVLDELHVSWDWVLVEI